MPSDQTNFKVEVNEQVQVLLHLHFNAQIRLKLCSVKYIVAVVYVRLYILPPGLLITIVCLPAIPAT